MTTQMLWIAFAIFIVGLFFGCNLGVVIMCVLQTAGRESARSERTLTYAVEADDVTGDL
jgi:hypothetical protein